MMICGQVPLVTVLNTLIAGLRQQLSDATGGSKVQFEPHSTRLPGAHTRDGGVVSILVMVWLQVLVLPQQSLASQTRVMICGQIPLVVVPSTATPCRQQVSVAMGVSKLQVAPHSTVRFVGQ